MRTPARRRTAGPARHLALLVAPLLLLTACGGDADETAVDEGATSAPTPVEPQAAPGPVRTDDLVMVLDTGDGPRLCQGPVTRSYPPQCSGPAIEGWRWRDQQSFDKAGDVRWGYFALTGTWDGDTFTVSDATPAALYSPPRQDEQDPPPPLRQRDEASINEIAREVSALSGVAGTFVEDNQVVVEVAYDDGALQQRLDEEYGANSVRVVPQLVDAG